MRTYEVRDWLKTLDVATNYYSGKIDNDKEKSICVYDDRMDGSELFVGIGGYECTKTQTFKATVVLQWNDNPRETEDAGYAFIDKLKEVDKSGNFKIGNHTVSALRILRHMYLGTNERGLCQRLIYFDLTYSN